MTNAFVVAFRDRGTDPLRQANLDYVLDYIASLDLGPVYVVSDGLTGQASFNRHAAYNAGAEQAFAAGAHTVTFYESDMIISKRKLCEGIRQSATSPGLVVPFTARHELNAADSEKVRAGADHEQFTGAVVMPKPRRTGAINIITKHTYDLVARYDPNFTGSHWDDKSMHWAFEVACGAGSTRWIPGPSWHLYHLPGHRGDHLTDADREATERNRQRWLKYRRATTPEQIRELTTE